MGFFSFRAVRTETAIRGVTAGAVAKTRRAEAVGPSKQGGPALVRPERSNERPSFLYFNYTTMKRTKGRKKRTAIVRVEQPSTARKVATYAATCATTACLGVGFEEFARWAWEAIKHLF